MIDPKRLKQGDEAYFAELVRTYGQMVIMVARAYGNDQDHIEDLFQEIWKRAYEKRATFSSRGSFEGWLHRLATNVCLGDYRSRQARWKATERMTQKGKAEELAWSSPDPLEEVERKELHSKIHRAIPHLPDREREALTLTVLERKAPAEVAEVMGVEASTVRSHIRNGIRHLRKIMEDPGDEMPRDRSNH